MIHLELQPEIEAEVASEAAACGLPVERYLANIVADRTPPEVRSPARQKEISDAIERILKLREGSSLNGLTIKELVNEGRKY